MATTIQFRRDTTTNWSAANPVLASGELGYDLTLKKFKIGDGTTAWNTLTFFESGGGGSGQVDSDWVLRVTTDSDILAAAVADVIANAVLDSDYVEARITARVADLPLDSDYVEARITARVADLPLDSDWVSRQIPVYQNDSDWILSQIPVYQNDSDWILSQIPVYQNDSDWILSQIPVDMVDSDWVTRQILANRVDSDWVTKQILLDRVDSEYLAEEIRKADSDLRRDIDSDITVATAGGGGLAGDQSGVIVLGDHITDEKMTRDYAGATGTRVVDTTLGNVFQIYNVAYNAANVINFTNLMDTATGGVELGDTRTITLILEHTTGTWQTPSIQIDGTTVTPLWTNGAEFEPETGTIQVLSITFCRTGTSVNASSSFGRILAAATKFG